MRVPVSPLLIFHICTATIALMAGGVSMIFKKGSGAHRVSGTIFFLSMLGMTSSGAWLGAFVNPHAMNVIGATLTGYLVVTGWKAGRRREMTTGAFDVGALLFILAIAIGALTVGFRTNETPAIYFVFGTVAMLFAFADIRMIRRGGVAGTKRMVRHLWRMCLSLLMTVMSFYPGNARLFSQEVRDTKLLLIPLIITIGFTLFWLVRVKFRGLPLYRRRRAAAESETLPAQPAFR